MKSRTGMRTERENKKGPRYFTIRKQRTNKPQGRSQIRAMGIEATPQPVSRSVTITKERIIDVLRTCGTNWNPDVEKAFAIPERLFEAETGSFAIIIYSSSPGTAYADTGPILFAMNSGQSGPVKKPKTEYLIMIDG